MHSSNLKSDWPGKAFSRACVFILMVFEMQLVYQQAYRKWNVFSVVKPTTDEKHSWLLYIHVIAVCVHREERILSLNVRNPCKALKMPF